MKGARRSRSGRGLQRILGGPFLILVCFATLGLVWLGIAEGPTFARQVWSLIVDRKSVV